MSMFIGFLFHVIDISCPADIDLDIYHIYSEVKEKFFPQITLVTLMVRLFVTARKVKIRMGGRDFTLVKVHLQ